MLPQSVEASCRDPIFFSAVSSLSLSPSCRMTKHERKYRIHCSFFLLGTIFGVERVEAANQRIYHLSRIRTRRVRKRRKDLIWWRSEINHRQVFTWSDIINALFSFLRWKFETTRPSFDRGFLLSQRNQSNENAIRCVAIAVSDPLESRRVCANDTLHRCRLYFLLP